MVTAIVLILIDAAVFYYQLKGLVDFFHISQIDSRDFKALPVGDIDHAFSVLFRDINYSLQRFDIYFTARAAYT